MKQPLKARSPAKLILSGEHSVVYGKPAIAMAIDCYAESTIFSSFSSGILFSCKNFKVAKSFTLHTLKALKQRLQEQYYVFLEGRCGIRDVLKKPLELLQYTVTHLLETWEIPLSEGLEIHASSNIPIGCGMGSSAAIVMSTLYALAHFLKIDIDPARYLSLGKDAENLQHGKSSGLDLQLAMMGGCLRFQEGRMVRREFPAMPLSIVQTGIPEATTGECISFAAKKFKGSTIANDFSAITEAFDEALQRSDRVAMQVCIKANQKLLVEIGVVPQRVQDFIVAIEKEGAAAKICGAGSVRGTKAGVVLVLAEKALWDPLASIAHQYGYPMQPVQGDFHGTHLV